MIDWVDVTPTMAREWLLHGREVALDPAVVDQYAAIMAAGMWTTSFAPIVFDRGHLRDGNHRLHAVIKADVTVRLPVDGLRAA